MYQYICFYLYIFLFMSFGLLFFGFLSLYFIFCIFACDIWCKFFYVCLSVYVPPLMSILVYLFLHYPLFIISGMSFLSIFLFIVCYIFFFLYFSYNILYNSYITFAKYVLINHKKWLSQIKILYLNIVNYSSG